MDEHFVTRVFSDRNRDQFSVRCWVPVRDGVVDYYDCAAIKGLENCHVTWSGGITFVQPRGPASGSNPDGRNYRKEYIKTHFCKYCHLKYRRKEKQKE